LISLFDNAETCLIPQITGLTYLPNFVTTAEANTLVAHIDDQSWRSDLKRRVQHYGYRYDYNARAVGRDAYLGAEPDRAIRCRPIRMAALDPRPEIRRHQWRQISTRTSAFHHFPNGVPQPTLTREGPLSRIRTRMSVISRFHPEYRRH
jgi:hypothetical protein